jgi:predicted nucleic acid-binding protein
MNYRLLLPLINLLAAQTKANYALSYVDAFVVAAAQREGAIVLTSDPEFQAAKESITIEWLDY